MVNDNPGREGTSVVVKEVVDIWFFVLALNSHESAQKTTSGAL